MSGTLSPNAQTKLASLGEFLSRVQHVHGLVEQYAAAKTHQDQLQMQMQRAFGKLKLQFMGAGFDTLSQLSGSMEIAAKRGLSQVAKARILREGVGSLKFQLELAQRTVVSEDQAEQRRAAASDDAAPTM